jgi:hypothetical protein
MQKEVRPEVRGFPGEGSLVGRVGPGGRVRSFWVVVGRAEFSELLGRFFCGF